MNQATLIRKLQTLTPRTPYGALLAKEFGVVPPDSAPKYQQEYLYKYCLSLEGQNLSTTQIVKEAAVKASELFDKFPWVTVKYNDLTPVKKEHIRKSTTYADGTVTHNPKNGMYFFHLNGKIDSRSNSLDGLKKVLTKKYGNKYKVGSIVTL